MRHADDGALHAYLDGANDAFDEGELEALEAHLAGCEGCRARLAEEREVRIRAASLLEEGSEPDPLSVPSYEALVRSRGPERAARAGTGRRLVLPWAAVFVLGLGLGWLARERAPLEPLAFDPRHVEETGGAPISRGPTPRSDREPGPPAGLARPPLPSPAAEPAASDPDPERATTAGAGRSDAGETAGADRTAAGPLAAPAPELFADREDATRSPAERAAGGGDSELVIREIVTAEGGRPLAGAALPLSGTGVETVTDRDGRHALTTPVREADSIRTVPVPARITDDAGPGRPEEAPRSEPVLAAAQAARTAEPAWTRIDEAGARGILGSAPPSIQGIPITGIESAVVGGVGTVRIRQRLGSGTTITLEVARLDQGRSRAEWTGAADGFVASDTREAAGRSEIVARSAELSVTLSASLPLAELEEVLDRLR